MRRATAVTARLLAQLRRDPRTLALLLLVPPLLVTLLRYVLDDQAAFDRVAAPMVGIFPFITMFLVTSITMLRERTAGTLERLMTTPLAKIELLGGYALAFGALATLQAVLTSIVAFTLLDVEVAGSAALVVGLAVANALLGMALGLLVSAFASTEFQAVQFMPAFVLPQLLLSGLFVARERMAPLLEDVANALPLTYAFDALQGVAVEDEFRAGDLAVVVAATLAAVALAALTLRRRTP